uniref:ANK_REP_REGION domain-containing protein n=1 Tax=Steinernema glaseri TaxID=37863 RepID=A0A1I7ZQT8_9BILA
MCDGTIFIDACRDGDVEKVRSMLEAKPGLVRYVEPFMHNYTPLHYAAKKGTLDVVKILVDSGANINALTVFLHVLLLDLTVCFQTFKYTALHLAAMGGKESVILYLEKQPDVKLDTRDVSGQTYEDYWGRPVGTKKPVEANRDERGADDKANASQGHGKKKPSAPRRLLKRVVPCCSGPSDSA